VADHIERRKTLKTVSGGTDIMFGEKLKQWSSLRRPR
jgi:hypothetical protein